MKTKIKTDLIKRYALFLFGLFIASMGVAFSTKARLGTSPVASLPYSVSLVSKLLTFGGWLNLLSVIQINTDAEQWVSKSPYLHSFDRLDEVHHQMEEAALTDTMNEIGFSLILQESCPLPNGEALVRLDYKKNGVQL